MSYFRIRRAPAYLALAATAAVLPLLLGCQPQTIIARVNDKPVTEQEFITAVQKVRQTSFQNQDPKMDAGGLALENKIQGILVDECAAEPALKAVPSDDTLKAYFTQVQRKYPNITNEIKSHSVDQEDVINQIKTTMEMLAIGTDGAKPDDKELQAEYDKHIADHALDYPALYTIRLLLAENREQANTALDEIKKTGDFHHAADMMGISPEQAATMIRATVYTGEQLPPPTIKVLDTLTPNSYTPEPIEFTVPANPNNPQATPPTPRYMIAQLIEKVPASVPKLASIKELVTQMALQEKYPQWGLHAAGRVAEFTEKANIQIMVDRYKPMLAEIILPAAKRNAAMAAGEAGGIGGALPGGAPADGAAPAPGSGAHP